MPRNIATDCASLSTTSLVTYDKYSSSFLDEATKHPPENLDGAIVWGTRYYMESLITAYEATHNTKYLTAFEDTGSWVMAHAQTMTFVDVPDPSAPGKMVDKPTITLTGWPTNMGAFGVPISVPSSNGAIALYAQSLVPLSWGADALDISQSNGTLQFSWTKDGNSLQSYSLSSVSDLYTIAAQPLVYRQSPGRIAPTGAGLPAVGTYSLNTPLPTIWHTEQSGGILLPFARFLLIAKNQPGLVDSELTASWQSMVLLIASQVASEFVPDGSGGYMLHNPSWMASSEAGTPAESDYVWAEISLRILLYELTADPSQLAFARGLLQHQLTQNIPISSSGWIVLRDWPDLKPWTSKGSAPSGSAFDSLSYDAQTPESSSDGGFFVEMLHLANPYGLTSQLGIPPSFYGEQSATFQQFLNIPDAIGLGVLSSARLDYPTLDSAPSDPLAVSDNPLAGSLYLEPETSSPEDWYANWEWMTAEATAPPGGDVGYFLRAWAQSEAALAQACVEDPPE